MVERVQLHRRQQQQGELVQTYCVALKQIAANCQFSPGEYDNRLRDIFVAGLCDDTMWQKFYEKDDLLTQSLDEVLVFARPIEGARDSVLATRNHSSQADSVQTVNRRWQGKKQPGPISSRKQIQIRLFLLYSGGRGTCFVCGERSHYLPNCPLRRHRNEVFCTCFERFGHLAAACRFGKSFDKGSPKRHPK